MKYSSALQVAFPTRRAPSSLGLLIPPLIRYSPGEKGRGEGKQETMEDSPTSVDGSHLNGFALPQKNRCFLYKKVVVTLFLYGHGTGWLKTSLPQLPRRPFPEKKGRRRIKKEMGRGGGGGRHGRRRMWWWAEEEEEEEEALGLAVPLPLLPTLRWVD